MLDAIGSQEQVKELQKRLKEYEKLMREQTRSWEERLRTTQERKVEEAEQLKVRKTCCRSSYSYIFPHHRELVCRIKLITDCLTL